MNCCLEKRRRAAAVQDASRTWRPQSFARASWTAPVLLRLIRIEVSASTRTRLCQSELPYLLTFVITRAKALKPGSSFSIAAAKQMRHKFRLSRARKVLRFLRQRLDVSL